MKMAYQIPRNVKGEGRILFIFSTKALITSGIGAGIGVVIWWIFNMIGLGTVRINNLNTFSSNWIWNRNTESTKYYCI